MIESWMVDDGSTVPVSSDAVSATLRARIGAGQLDTFLISSSGRALAFVTNTVRTMVVLVEGEGDPGEHAVGSTQQCKAQ
ncbi:hypothetical protein ACIQ7Q_22365 [Streptomyces sp. NPDC096176]|uniref:hypothetical protein n=1 Tax=Streptomyces sp. NPDC096176 TaxID=3366079 RepID=UPI00381A5980